MSRFHQLFHSVSLQNTRLTCSSRLDDQPAFTGESTNCFLSCYMWTQNLHTVCTEANVRKEQTFQQNVMSRKLQVMKAKLQNMSVLLATQHQQSASSVRVLFQMKCLDTKLVSPYGSLQSVRLGVEPLLGRKTRLLSVYWTMQSVSFGTPSWAECRTVCRQTSASVWAFYGHVAKTDVQLTATLPGHVSMENGKGRTGIIRQQFIIYLFCAPQ